MGVVSPREKIESKILKLKYRRVEIEEERNERIKQLQNLTGKEINRPSIPDYIETDDINKNNNSIQSQSHSAKGDKMKRKNNNIKNEANKNKNLINGKNDNKRKKNENENNFEKKSKKRNNIKNNKNKKQHFHQITKE